MTKIILFTLFLNLSLFDRWISAYSIYALKWVVWIYQVAICYANYYTT